MATQLHRPHRFMTIRYLNGKLQTFEFEQATDDHFLPLRIKETTAAGYLLIELADQLNLIPLSGIQHIELGPKPDELPPSTIRKAKLVYED